MRHLRDGRVVTHAEARTRMQRRLASGAIDVKTGGNQLRKARLA
jgi:hypothetical protein